MLTAQAEVLWHRTRELAATGVFENLTAYRELLAGFTTRLHDLKDRAGEEVLNPEPRIANPIGKTLSQDLLGFGGNRLLYPSTRRDGGRCVVAFRPHLVQNVRQGDTWTFAWRGEVTPKVTRAS